MPQCEGPAKGSLVSNLRVLPANVRLQDQTDVVERHCASDLELATDPRAVVDEPDTNPRGTSCPNHLLPSDIRMQPSPFFQATGPS